MRDKVIIFGTGSVAEILYKELKEDLEIVAFVNTNREICSYHGYMVIDIDELVNYDYDWIIVASGYYIQIERKLLNAGVIPERIIGFIFDEEETYQDISKQIDEYLNQRFHREQLREMVRTDRLLPEFFGCVTWKNNGFDFINKDYVREQLLAYLAQEIERKKVKGAVAELGVFQGDYTVVINKGFPDKKLYLFDTFEGFAATDVTTDEKVENKNNEIMKFRNTSEEMVLNRIGEGKERCIVKKGWFPETFDLFDEKFCFVSIDMNMYNPVMKGMELFFPRLSKGGYMMISDFNAPFYEGTRKAIIDYCDLNEISFLPVPDLYGSVIISK